MFIDLDKLINVVISYSGQLIKLLCKENLLYKFNYY